MGKSAIGASALQRRLMVAAVASCFAAGAAYGNPTGHSMAHGAVGVSGGTGALTITNLGGTNAIINWNSFSIDPGELTRFQNFIGLSVLNRVTGTDVSSIMGTLSSDGRLFLINPNGIFIGGGAVIDVPGFVASTLDMSNGDFLAGKMRFQELPGTTAGLVENYASINVSGGGPVYLVGRSVTNGGVITNPSGEIVLAAGQTVELMEGATPGVSVLLTAPGDRVLNLSSLSAGRVGIYGGLVEQAGFVGADAAFLGPDGSIQLRAMEATTFAPGSATFATGTLDIDTGGLLVSGYVQTGPQTIRSTQGLQVQNGTLGATGGQAIEAQFLEVASFDGGFAGIMNSGGTQRILTTGVNGAGEGLAVRRQGPGFATISNSFGEQQIDVRDAERAVIDQGFVFNDGSLQTLSLTGAGANALVLGRAGALGQSVIAAGLQNVVAGNSGEQGSITITGTAAGGPANTFIVSGSGGSQTVSTSGALTIIGGSAVGGTAAGIFANSVDGQQFVAADSIHVQGGDTGSGNSAQIGANSGSQVVHASSIVVTGGAGGTSNTAMLRASAGPQTIVADEITVYAGAGGVGNFAVVIAPQQVIAVSGDVTLNGGSSTPTPTTGAAALIGGGNNLPTNLNLAVGGDLTLNGGHAVNSGAVIGNGLTGLQPTSITANVGGDVTLNPGTAANARIGSGLESPLGGDVVINAGGTIAMNSAGPGLAGAIRTGGDVALSARRVTQDADARIEASALSVLTAEGASLAGANRVSELAMLNSVSGDVAFNNASVLLTVSGIGQVPDGALALMQQGDLHIVGDITSGAQTIAASGDLKIAAGDGPGITVRAHGPQTFNVGGTFSLLGGSAWDGYTQTLASGPVSITTGNDLLVRGGGGLLAYALLYGGDDIHLTVGKELRIDSGSGLLAFARVQTDFWDRIFLTFPNRESGGYFVNGQEGATFRRLSGFYTGLLPAVPGRSLVVEYGE